MFLLCRRCSRSAATGTSKLASRPALRQIIRKTDCHTGEVDLGESRFFTHRQNSEPTLVIVTIGGLFAFFLPIVISALPTEPARVSSREAEASMLLALIVGGALIVAVGELVRGSATSSRARSVALLGALVATDATLRLIPSFLGASPIFALILLVGYVYGPRIGFVMGSLTLLLSAAITAGVGPWLPFQMLCAGWVGLASGWLPTWKSARAELATAVAFGVVTGFAYGALMNLYSWPFAAPGVSDDVELY
jgi:energy-coupling factor transport system substrate-specific component